MAARSTLGASRKDDPETSTKPKVFRERAGRQLREGYRALQVAAGGHGGLSFMVPFW